MKNILIRYCDAILTRGDYFNINEPLEELYKIMYDELNKLPIVYELMLKIKNEIPDLYSKFMEIGNPEDLEKSDSMVDMGF